MNGAESLVRTLANAGIEVCFANPGTSEMHFVAALDGVREIRCVLGLFEGVVTGAADGYARMAGKPAATLLHLGPGLGNGLANLHNARKGSTAIVNIVGEHASWHIELDAPLTADIEGIARPVSHWVKTAKSSSTLAEDGAAAVAAASEFPGNIATLILPANTAWEEAQQPAEAHGLRQPPTVPAKHLEDIAQCLQQGEPVAIILGSHALNAEALEHASRVAQFSGATLLAETFNARFQRGAGRVPVSSVPYVVDQAIDLLKEFKHVITVCAKAPVAFFAYPDKPSKLYPSDAVVHTLAEKHENGSRALADLAAHLKVDALQPELQTRQFHPEPEDGPLNPEAIAITVANLMPENAIVVDESITCGRGMQQKTRGSEAHDWLQICGGSIGGGFPVATGAAIACPNRQVLALQADGSGMYTLQALWTQARESLNITTVIFANRCYAILKHELDNVQANSSEIALDMMELNRPNLDWVSMANGMGVPAAKVNTVDEFKTALQTGLATDGPYLIEAVIV